MIALVGGTGALPAAVAARLAARGEPYLLCELDGFPMEAAGPRRTFRLERLGTLLADLRAEGAEAACLVGAVRRPRLDPSLVDAATAALLRPIAAAMGQGDDAALRAVIGAFEAAGLRVVGAHEISPDLLPPPGVLGRVQPTDQHRRDARRAEAVHRAMAAADLGQACIVRAGQVIAVEASPGTDWMIDSVHSLAEGGLLWKAPKAGQDRRADLPTIGPATVERAAGVGLRAVAIEAGGVLLLDQEAAIEAADRLGIALWVREPGA